MSDERTLRAPVPGTPGLTLVLGPPNSGKMGYVLEWWHERLPLRPIVVVPTGPGAHELTVEMVRRAGALIGQSPALTFDGLVRAILRSAPRQPTEFERVLIMSRLLRRTTLRSLDRVASLPGAATSLAALVIQLDESGKSGEEVDRILRRWASADPGSAALADDLLRLHQAYAQACRRRGLTDGASAVREATCQIAGEAAGWGRPVALYGFTSFTPGQRALIEALSRRGQALVTLPYDSSRCVNLSTAAEVSRWQALTTETVELTPRIRAYSSPAIAYLERNFMSDRPLPGPPPVASGPQGVRFLLASGQRNEAELAAQHIAALIRDGFRPGDIAVVVRRTRPWRGLLAQVFESCGIPYHSDEQRSLAETGLGNAFLSVLRGVIRDDADALLAYLRGPYSGVDPEAAGDLELRYRRRTARGARALAETGEQQHPGLLLPLWNIVATEEGVKRVALPALEALRGRMLVAGLRNAVVGSRDAEEDAQAFRALGNALSTLAQLPEDEDPVGGLDPEVTVGALGKVLVSDSRSGSADAVQILSVQRARARRFAVVAVLGLVEGEFPGGPETPSFLTSEQRARIDSVAGGGFLPVEPEHEGALFASAVSRAWQLLLLSARDADDGGGEAVPSYFWHLAKELLGVSEHEHETRTLGDVVFDPGSAPTLRHYLRTCAASGNAPHPALSPGLVPAVAAARTQRQHCERLTDPGILAELDGLQSFTPSSLEAYLACPFAWFMERVVGIDELDHELDGRVFGQLLHDALSAAYCRLQEAGALPLRPGNLAEASRMASTIIDGLVETDTCPGSIADKRVAGWRMKQLADNLFRMECGEDCSLVVSETESRLGGSEGIDLGGLRLRGRLDRIDAAPRGQALFVIDYKSGAAPASSSIGTGRALQLPLYMMALAAERPDAEIIGGAYLSLSESRRSGVITAGNEEMVGGRAGGCRVLDPVGAQELFQQAREAALAAAGGMRAGLIAPRADRDCPPWCRLGPVCRSRAGRRRT